MNRLKQGEVCAEGLKTPSIERVIETYNGNTFP